MITVNDLKELLGIETSDRDRLLELLESSAVEYLQNATKRYFGPLVSATDRLKKEQAHETLWIHEQPKTTSGAISAPTSVLELAYPGATGTVIAASATDGFELQTFYQYREARLVRHGGAAWQGGRIYVVGPYIRGYPTDGEPPEIRRTVLAMVDYNFMLHRRGVVGITSERIADYSYTLALGDQGGERAVPAVDATIRGWTRRAIS